ncbi:MAG: hypothetical protein QM346_15040, partial [Chloroflexota bacterium]|nr:hypothetical protein [Chloroflexota bacterium]
MRGKASCHARLCRGGAPGIAGIFAGILAGPFAARDGGVPGAPGIAGIFAGILTGPVAARDGGVPGAPGIAGIFAGI